MREAGMNSDWTYDPDMPIETVMRRWPETIPILVRHRMLCVGCPIGGFHTIPEACEEHEIDETAFVDELVHAIAAARAATN
jgi:hybrid cluster-associated redox disulfide protein